VVAIEELHKCPDPNMSILSTYPHDRNAYGIQEESVPMMCGSSWDSHGIPVFSAVIKNKRDFKGKPLQTPFISGGFMFAPGHIVATCPFDHGLDNLFQGEEILYSARAWTHGYDIFCPSRNVCLHHYYRDGKGVDKQNGEKKEKAPKFWEDIPGWADTQKKSVRRVKRLLSLEEPRIAPGEDPYSLGSKRSIAMYWAYSGLDPIHKTSISKQKFNV